MKFCSECASPVELMVPAGDNRPRYVCAHCDTIHYQNPKMVIGSIPVWEKDGKLQVLLCKRAIEPRRGYWTLPAGFMENNETTADAARRETAEEAGANIELGKLFTLLNLAKLKDLDFAPGEESLEVRLFTEQEIPWDDLAFPTVSTTLEFFFTDRDKVAEGGSYGFHELDITRPMRLPTGDTSNTSDTPGAP